MNDYSSQRRANPSLSLFDPDYAILAQLVPTLEGFAARQPATVLDFGAGNVPYKKIFQASRYIAADLTQNQMGSIDLILGGGPLPLADDSIDLILCIYVLEHIKSYVDILEEFNRVLRPGGQLFVVTPFIYREHEAPRDFHRPTSFALTQDLQRIGPTIVQKIGNSWFTLYALANEMHIKEGERIVASRVSRCIRGGFRRLLLPIFNCFIFCRPVHAQGLCVPLHYCNINKIVF